MPSEDRTDNIKEQKEENEALVHYGNSEISNMQSACERGEGGALEWLEQTRRRISLLDQAGVKLNAILEWNLEAEGIAYASDHERIKKGARSLLHGIPILLKDNIETGDAMHASGGALALADRFADRDSFIAARLRASGAVLCGKTNMTELANFMTENMPNGYSSRGGQVRHAWKADADPSGSSTGSAVAVAAGYVPLAIGTETCGSITSPAAAAGIVALKPTIGWVSRRGIIPIAPSQDVAGPMARTVADCAIAFSIIAGCDIEDPVTGICAGHKIPEIDRRRLNEKDLKGVRLGLFALDDEDKPIQCDAFYKAVKLLESMGAEIIPFSPPKDAARGMITVFIHEFRPSMDAVLRHGTGPVRSMADLAAFNKAHSDVCLRYGQTNIEQALSLERPMLTHEYVQSREIAHQCLEELKNTFALQSLDAVISLEGLIVFPVTGCPALTLPVGIDETKGMPVPITINGLPFSEGKLLTIGAVLEAAIGKDFKPPLPLE